MRQSLILKLLQNVSLSDWFFDHFELVSFCHDQRDRLLGLDLLDLGLPLGDTAESVLRVAIDADHEGVRIHVQQLATNEFFE